MTSTLAASENPGVRTHRRHRTHHSRPGRPQAASVRPYRLLRGPRSDAHATADNLVDRNHNPSRGGRPGHRKSRNPLDQPLLTRVQVGPHLARVSLLLRPSHLPGGPRCAQPGTCHCRSYVQAVEPSLRADAASITVRRMALTSVRKVA